MPTATNEKPIRVNLKLHPLLNRRLEDARAKIVPPQTKQRYIEDAILLRLGWKTGRK